MIRARLNAKGLIAAPGALQVLGRTVTLGRESARQVEIDVSGFTGGYQATVLATPGDGLSVVDGGMNGDVWSLSFLGAGMANLSVITLGGREWSAKVVVR